MVELPARRIYPLLQWASFAVCTGYAWLAFSGKISFHTLFWNENFLASWVTRLTGMDWNAYAADPNISRAVDKLMSAAGIVLTTGAGASLALRRFPKPAKVMLYTGAFIMLANAVLLGVERIFFLVQFSEYALQWSAPLFLIAASNGTLPRRFIPLLKAAASVTFAAHGLYALGIYPRPGNFVDMTMTILHIKETAAIDFLKAAGTLDLAAAILIWLPWRGVQQAGTGYMIAWGALTALARWAAHVHFELPWWPRSLMEWTPEVLIRVPHFLGPLALWMLSAQKRQFSGLAV